MEWYLGFGAVFVMAVGAIAFGCCTGKASAEYPKAETVAKEERPKDISAPIYGFVRAVKENPGRFKFNDSDDCGPIQDLSQTYRYSYYGCAYYRYTANDRASGIIHDVSIIISYHSDTATYEATHNAKCPMRFTGDEAEFLYKEIVAVQKAKCERLKELKNIRARRELAKLYP
jgi:hypothetical protein